MHDVNWPITWSNYPLSHSQFSQSPTEESSQQTRCILSLLQSTVPLIHSIPLKDPPCRPGRLGFFLFSSERLLLELPPIRVEILALAVRCLLFLLPTLYFYSNSIPRLPSHHQPQKTQHYYPPSTQTSCALCAVPPFPKSIYSASCFGFRSRILFTRQLQQVHSAFSQHFAGRSCCLAVSALYNKSHC
jgi:hypothetical protein